MTDWMRTSAWHSWHQGLVSRPGLVMAATFVLVVLSLFYSANHLRIDTNTADMISEEVPFRQHDRAFKQSFPAFKETIVAVIDGDTPERSAEAAARLAAAATADLEHFVKVDQPGDDPFFERNGLLYLNLEMLGALSDRLAEAQPLLAALADDPNLRGLADFIRLVLEQTDDPKAAGQDLDQLFSDMAATTLAASAEEPRELSWRRLLGLGGSLSGSRRLVLIEPTLDYGSLTPGAKAIAALRTIAADLGINAEDGLEIRLTGSAALEHEELKSASGGAIWAGMVATAGVTILLIWGLGSARLIAATLLTLFAGLVITAGLATLLIGRLNLISVTFAVLFVGLGVDFGIHLSLRYKEAISHRLNHERALCNALSRIGGPLTLSAVCAALGFIAFVPTDYRGLAELGIISAVGMAVAWAMSLTLLPALLNMMPLPSKASTKPAGTAILPWTERHANIVLGSALVLAILALPLLLKVSFDFNPLNLRDPASESVSTFLDLEKNPDTTANVINALAADLTEAGMLADSFRSLREIGDVITLQSFVPDDQDAKLDMIDEMAFFLGSLQPTARENLTAAERKEAFQRLSSAIEASSKDRDSGLARLETNLADFAAKTDLADDRMQDLEQRLTRHLSGLLKQLDLALQAAPIDLATLPDNLRDKWINEAGEARVLVRPAIGISDNRTLARFADAALHAVPTATGTPIIITQAGRAVVGAFVEASGIAFALITVLLFIILRRVTDVLLVLAPLALAILLTGATSVVLDLQLNFANVIVLPLLLGLGVSGAIHVVMRRHQDREAEDSEERQSFGASSTSRAIFFSALTTIASFGSLAISAHRGMASMGLLLTVAILWSLVCTLIVLPALLSLFEANQDTSA